VTLSGKNQKLSDGDYGASGCTTAALTISAVKELVGASFYCIISGEDDNTVQSAAAKLSITIPEDAPETTPAVDAPTGGDSGGGNTILIVVILLVVVLGAGGIGMVLMNKKKNR